MKIRQTIIVGIAAAGGFLFAINSVWAQEQLDGNTPQKIENVVKVQRSAEWYRAQESLWRAKVEKNPKNEEAWNNYYRAARYGGWENDMAGHAEHLDSIVEAMCKAIPNTYTASVVKFKNNGYAADNPGMGAAIDMRPDAVVDYPSFVSYLMQTGDYERMTGVLKRWYNCGEYSPALLNYAYNELVGLAPDAIIFVHGDTPTYSALMLKYGKGMRPDITIVNVDFMAFYKEYREHIEKKLGLPSFSDRVDDGTYTFGNSYSDATDAVYRHVIENCNRPVYFSSLMEMPKFTDRLYSEGLVMRYSEKPYDNLAVKRRNYEELYLTDYLRESFLPESYPASITPLNFNYIPCFKSLLDHYKKSGNASRYNELRNLMLRIVEQIDVPEEKKLVYYEEIDR